MSRIGKLPVQIPEKVEVKIEGQKITAKGPIGERYEVIHRAISVKQEDNNIILERPSESKHHRSLHGLCRALIQNLITGVSEGFTIKQEVIGVGFKATTKGQILELSLGYSHDILFEMPDTVKVEAVTEKRASPIITYKSANKQLVGQVAAKVKSLRKPEPYKGKGIRYLGEYIRKKAGKTASV